MRMELDGLAIHPKHLRGLGCDHALRHQLGGGFALFKVWVDGKQGIRPEVAVRILRINGRLQILGADLAERTREA